MRTRFLTDFFNSSAVSQSLQTLDFLRFPPPQLTSPDPINFDNLYCFDQITSVKISPEIERFSVDEALSKFFSDVLPQNINAENDQQIAREVTSEEKINDYLDAAAKTNFTVFKFETPALPISLENSCFLHEEKLQILFEVTDAEVSPDLADFSLEVQKLMDINKSIFYVEDLTLEFKEEHKSDLFEDTSLIKAQISSNLRPFPLLEIDETSLGINNYISEDKRIIFESNESEQWMQKEELTTFDPNELLISMNFDLLEHLLNPPPVTCQNLEPARVDISSENEIINVIEQAVTLGPIAFEQFQFFDIKTSHFAKMFLDTKIINEEENCEQMFGNTTVTTFNSLIVTHELILKDDSFKSLPVPIISDQERVFSVQMIIEEMFLKVKLQPSSTSDDIYLDWQLLEEDICSDNICKSLKMFEDIETYSINADMSSCDCEILILEFVLSDSCSNEQITEEKPEQLNIEKSSNLSNQMDSVSKNGNFSSKLNDECQVASEEGVIDNKVKKGHQVVESMTQFNDLDFFLNPLEANCVKKQKSADQKLETDYRLPLISGKSQIETCDISQKQQKSLDNEFHSRGDFTSNSTLNEISNNSEGSLHSKPTEENTHTKSLKPTYELPQMESTKVNPNTTNAIIIVNTQNTDSETIISRRNTYQRILAMEKEGVQVVERDLNLPIDVIISAAVCLVLYDIKNIKRKTTSSSDNGSSSFLSSCVENIAANVLTGISFAFSCCILIFEGEIGFLSSIMESSDELYAAAASLGIDLQLFCSYSSEITDDIILKCISHAAKSTIGLYPKMPESETLAESFLSKFPSLNPLSSHVILSSVGTLLQFLEMPHQQRVNSVKKYLVPEASIGLFTALCKYGEREDSRSGMTDCCSSVSSGHDSGSCCPKNVDERKKRKERDHMFQFEQNDDVMWNLEAENKAFDEICFAENQRSDSDPCMMMMMMNRPSLTDTSFGQSKKVHKLVTGTNNNFKGEVIDIDDDDDMAVEDFTFVNPTKLSPDWCSLPSFPTSAQINPDLDSWIPTNDNMNNSIEQITLNSNSNSILRNNNINLEDCSIVNSPVNFSYSRTPLSKAISSNQPQKGSPWTMDFLNRIKEKSRIRQQSMPNLSPAPCFGYSGNSSKLRKRKSPSILDFYRYQRSSNVESNGQKSHLQPSSSSKGVKKAPSSSQIRTPIDKRSKRKLTFATNGSKGQSKLIWSDKTDQNLIGML